MYDITFLQVKVPQLDETEIEAAEHFFSSLYGIKRSFFERFLKGEYNISFEIVSKQAGIGFYVVVPDELVTFVEKQINANYPEAEIDIIDPNEVWDRGKITEIAHLKLKGQSHFPIKTYKDMEENDPISTITASMSKLKEDEVVAIQYIVSPASEKWRKAGSAVAGQMRARAADPDKKGILDEDAVKAIETKVNNSGFHVGIRIVAIAGDAHSAKTHVRNVASAFEQFTNIKHNRFITKFPRFKKIKWIDDFIYRTLKVVEFHIPIFEIAIFRNVSILNTTEMASVFHFPNHLVKTPNIEWLTARRASAPTNVPQEGLYLGINEFRNTKRKIHMTPSDRVRHLYIIGQTGTGKSVFMSSLAYQDIIDGHGVAYIDPHGSEIDKLLHQIPKDRVKDVVLFDVSDIERPLGINLLEAHSEEEKHMIINAFIALLYKMYDPNRTGIMGPKLERAIRNVMLTAMIDPSSTLVDVLRLLIDTKYSQQFIPKIKDPLVKKYWTDEVAKTSDFHKSETMGYFVSKFDRFVTEQVMRNILGQPKSAIDFKKIMAEKKIFLADLSKGKIGEENSNFLGLILVPKILSAALARSKMISAGQDFPNFYLYVDEFQNFATPDFATILSEARKYKLNLTVAHQFVSQLPDEIKEAIFGNVGTMMVFRIGTEDAEIIETQFEPTFTATDLINITIGNCYTRLLINGQPSKPFSITTDWPWISNLPTSKETAQSIRENSRMTYGKPVKEVEEYINMRSGFLEEEEKPKPKIDPKKLIPF